VSGLEPVLKKLEELGESIWKNGPQQLRIEALRD